MNKVGYMVFGYLAGFALGMAFILMVDTTAEVGVLVGFGSTMLGLLVGRAAS
jgi:hypothetical protein